MFGAEVADWVEEEEGGGCDEGVDGEEDGEEGG